MPAAVYFYRDVLGFELVNQSQDGDEFDWCLLSRRSAELMLNTMYERESRPPQPDAKRAAAHADTGLFFACRELDLAYENLRDQGVDLQTPCVAPQR